MGPLYPVMLDLAGRHVLVVGGGPVGVQKARGLVAAQAVVTMVAKEAVGEVASMAAAGEITLRTRAYVTTDLAGQWLVIAATGDPVLQQRIHDDCTKARIFVNCADEPERCTFILPAVHRDGPITISVSTAGSSPALAGWLRDRAAASLPANVAAVAEELGRRRASLKADGTSTEGIDWHSQIESLLGES